MKVARVALGWAFVLSVCSVGAQATAILPGSQTLLQGGTAVASVDGIRCVLDSRQDGVCFQPQARDWSQYTHLLITIKNNLAVSSVASISVASGASGWGGSDFYVGPNETRTVAIPLQALPLWQAKFPPAISTTVAQTSAYGDVTKSNIRMVFLWNLQIGMAEDLTLVQLQPVSYTIPTTGIVDLYGQQTITFAGKVTADSQLVQDAASDALLSGQFPWSNDSFGGVAGTSSGATGKWRTAKQNGHWYILTPSGNRFFSTGINCAGAGVPARTDDRPNVFAAGALPSPSGPMGEHYRHIGGQTGFSFYEANLERKFGSDWDAPSSANNAKRMRTWGFNTLGAVSWDRLYNSATGLASMPVEEIRNGGSFRTIPCPGTDFPMPDPYDPQWGAVADAYLTPIIAKLNENPSNAGMFVDNELPWAAGASNANYQFELAFDVLSAPADQPAKKKFYNTLLLSYRTIQKLNAAWGTNYSSWTAFLNNPNYHPTALSAALTKDLQTFMTGISTQYYSTIRSILTRRAYKGLYLGSRYSFYSREVVQSAVRYCDVLSFNAYDQLPSNWRSDLKALDFPVMISEFSFSSSENGGIGGFPISASTEEDRIEAYQAYIQDASTFRNLVGIHWYKWEDDPVSGRLGDNVNTTYGLVSITDRPHQALIDAVTQANINFQARLLQP